MDEDALVFFIYDSVVGINLKEEDDPADAIPYFYPPSWGKNKQCWLCGTLTSLARHLSTLLGYPPEILKLENRKYALTTTDQYQIVFGVPTDEYSDFALSDAVGHIRDIMLFFYPSANYLISSAAKEYTLNSIINCLLTRPWADLEFNPISFLDSAKLSQQVMLKCADVVKFASTRNGVFGSCLFFQKRIIQSLLGPKITKLVQFCISCDVLRKKMGDPERGCSFVPVFVSNDDYEEIVRKLRQRLCAIGWEPYCNIDIKESDNDWSMNQFDNGLSEEPLSLENVPSVSNITLVDDIRPRAGSSSSESVSQHSLETDDAGEETVNTAENSEPAAADQPLQSSNGLFHPDISELALCAMNAGEVCLAVLMDKYSSQYSPKLAKNTLQECMKHLLEIDQELENAIDRNDDAEPINEGRQSVEHCSASGRMEPSQQRAHDFDLQKLTAATRDDLSEREEYKALLLRDSKASYVCKKTFARTRFVRKVQL